MFSSMSDRQRPIDPDCGNVAPKEVEWGPEIKVQGKRPEWLGDDEEFGWKGVNDEWTAFNDWTANELMLRWNEVSFIRLHANHSHYTKPATPTRTALEQRMEDCLKSLASEDIRSHQSDGVQAAIFEARAILAELEPVDPDLQIAREIADSFGLSPSLNLDPIAAAIKRGRALERGESPVTNEGAGR